MLESNKEFDQLEKLYGKEVAYNMILLIAKHKGNTNEIKRAALSGTLRTSKNSSGGIGNRIQTGKTISTNKISGGK